MNAPKSPSVAAAWRAALLFPLAIAMGGAVAADEARITEETPYVQSPDIVVDTMLQMAGVRADDVLLDLGSGDGRIIITAAKKYGARGTGIEYDPRLVKLANDNARAAGVSDKARFVEQDIFKTDLAGPTVLTIYLLPEYNMALRPKVLALAPGTRVVAHDYGFGDWEPDEQRTIPVPEKKVGVNKSSLVMAWTIPARIAGNWQGTITSAAGVQKVRLELSQQFQKFTGALVLPRSRVGVEGTMRGNDVKFSLLGSGRPGLEPLPFVGKLGGDAIEGRLAVDEGEAWTLRLTRESR